MELALSSPKQFVDCAIKMKGMVVPISSAHRIRESPRNLYIFYIFLQCKAIFLHNIPATQGKVDGKHAVQVTEFVIVCRSMDMALSHNSMWLWEKDDEKCGENDEEAGVNILTTSEQIKSF